MSVLHSLLPVFCLVALGCIMGRRFDPGPFSRLALLVTSPALIFVLIHDTRPAASDWLLLGGSALAIMCCCGLVTHLVLRAKLLPGVGRGLYLPAMFWNAGNLGLSVLERSDGLAGKAAGSLVFVTILSAQAVFGTWIAKGRGGGRE
ncbi:MAG: hypothetical protein KDB53_16060, partial [Planctomycetes bacterium]|nr:hypothetical protein [Planctomycetota bacterium]